VAKARILATRPEPLIGGLVRKLTAANFEAVPLPLLEIRPIDIHAEAAGVARQLILNLDLFTKVIFISRNAARIGSDLIDQYWPQFPVGVDWFAIGAGTAAELAKFGIEAQVNAGLDSESLLAAPQLQDLAEQRILIVKGVGGRDLLAQTLEARGAKVDSLEVYDRVPCRYTNDELLTRLNGPIDAALISSGEALLAYTQLERPVSDLILVPSERVADQARALDLTDIIVAQGASDEAMIATLEQRFNQIP